MDARIVLAIRARIYREGLVSALSAREGVVVVSAESTAAGTLDAVMRLQPDLVLVDVGIEGASNLARSLASRQPAISMIALAVNDDEAELLCWAEAGAVGFVTCENSIDELVACVDAALRHEFVCSARLSAVLLRRLSRLASDRPAEGGLRDALTPRQSQIMQHVRAGMSNKQIARDLGIELATVKNHVHRILQRLNVRRRRDIASAVGEVLRSPASNASRLSSHLSSLQRP